MNKRENNVTKPKKHKLSRISTLHYIKFVLRSCMMLTVMVMYIIAKVNGQPFTLDTMDTGSLIVLGVIGLYFAVEMILRFFPSKLESMGCQKQFAKNFQPTGKTLGVDVKKPSCVPVLITLAFWVLLNGAFGVAYYLHLIDDGILMILSLAYSICDMICILFFCPFQSWIMKNKCCSTCRIYNWDFAMMFTPMLFLPGIYTWTLLGLSLALVGYWEIAYLLHPERFLESTNACMSCKNCPEKLCQHKPQLRRFLARNRKKLNLKDNTAVGSASEK